MSDIPAASRDCAECGRPFRLNPRDSFEQRDARRFCSRKCCNAFHRTITPVADRLLNSSMPITESGCWLWLGQLCQLGYGTIRIGRKMIKAHRASWEVHAGEKIPSGMCVLHRCDVRSCINPDHLFIGTQRENVYDMLSKKRAWWQKEGIAA